MNQPFFSIVIPTKNRSFLIKAAIRSVLKQSFKDFEVVIADNDDTDRTRCAVEELGDQHIKYFRTGSLPMPENWDFAFSKAKGEYILLIEDKQLLRIRALEKIYAAIQREKPLVVSWCYDQVRDEQTPVRSRLIKGTGKYSYILSDELIESFLNCGRGDIVGRALPRGLNSCIHHTLVEQIRNNSPDGHLCLPTAPDYTFAFMQLAFIERFLHIDEALVIVRGYKYSTGRNFKIKHEAADKFVKEIGGESLLYDKVPIKTILVINCLFNDYERVRTRVGGRLSDHPLNLFTYFFQCYIDIHESKKLGADMSMEEEALRKALSSQDKTVRDSLFAVMKFLDDKISQLRTQTERAEKFKYKFQNKNSVIDRLKRKLKGN